MPITLFITLFLTFPLHFYYSPFELFQDLFIYKNYKSSAISNFNIFALEMQGRRSVKTNQRSKSQPRSTSRVKQLKSLSKGKRSISRKQKQSKSKPKNTKMTPKKTRRQKKEE